MKKHPGKIFSSLVSLMLAAASLLSSGQDVTPATDTVNAFTTLIQGNAAAWSPDKTGKTSISAEDFNKGLILNAEGLIAGRFQGLLSRLDDGSPSAGYSLESLRNSTFHSSLAPLIVVDGVPFEGMPLMLNPHDIESITWQNTGQASDYGSLARNGALVIETKRGGEDLSVTYSGNIALSSVNTYSVLTGDQFREALYERYSDEPDILARAGTANTDWQDEIYRPAFSHDHHLGISGTLASVPFRFSVGQTCAQGTVKTTEYRKTSLAGSMAPSLFNNHLEINLNGFTTPGRNNSVIPDLPYFAARADPTNPVYINNDPVHGFHTGENFINPVAILGNTSNVTRLRQYYGNLSARYKMHFMPSLNLGVRMGFYGHSDDNERVNGSYVGYYTLSGTNSTLDESFNARVIDLSAAWESYLKKINGRLNLVAGYYLYDLQTEVRELVTEYAHPENIWLNSIRTSEKSRRSFYGKASLLANNRYNIAAILRQDIFSEFIPELRSTLSPSLTAEWNVAGESFFPGTAPVDYLTLAFTWGATGVSSATDQEEGLFSPYLRPESGQYFISGISLSLADRTLQVSVNAWLNQNRDMIAGVAVPFGQTFLVNTGEVDNRGIELRTDAALNISEELEWNASLHLTIRGNRIRSVGSGMTSVNSGYLPYVMSTSVMIQEAGFPVNTFFQMRQVYDENGMPIDGLYVDYNNDGSPGGNEDKYHGYSAEPEFIAGFRTSLRYRDWNLSLSASSSAGNYVYNIESLFGNYRDLLGFQSLRNISTLVYDSGFTRERLESDYHVQNGTFLRVDFVSLGYNFRNIAGRNMDVCLSATLQNALTLTGYRGLDPDIAGGIYRYNWPRPQVASLNLSIGF